MTPVETETTAAIDHPLVVLIPLYNDWAAAALLLGELDRVLHEHAITAGVLLVDDGSTIPGAGFLADRRFRAIMQVDVLELRRNLGHQRAIAIGLAYVEDQGRCAALVVMDSDGEDDPRDVPRLLARQREVGANHIVFAERTRRSESWRFRVLYALYKILHYVLTGTAVRVGNFSVIPRRRLSSLVVVSELWNHYAAAAFRSRQPYVTVPTHRAKRLCGESRMNLIDLVVHGLSAISVYSEVVGVRLLVLAFGLMVLDLLGITALLAVQATTEWALPGWTTTAVALLLVLLVQAVVLACLFSFIVLGNRHSLTFVPSRDYRYFLRRVMTASPPR